MKLRNKIKSSVILIVIFVVLVLSVIWLANYEQFMDPGREAELEYQNSVQRNYLMTEYMEILHIKGEYTIEDDEVIIIGKEQYLGKLIEDVALYNTFYPEDKLSAEELNYEFEIFCEKWITSDNILKLKKGLIEIEYRAKKAGINLEDYGYHLKVAKQLDNYGTNIYDATTEQWYDASEYAAGELYKEVLSKE